MEPMIVSFRVGSDHHSFELSATEGEIGQIGAEIRRQFPGAVNFSVRPVDHPGKPAKAKLRRAR